MMDSLCWTDFPS